MVQSHYAPAEHFSDLRPFRIKICLTLRQNTENDLFLFDDISLLVPALIIPRKKFFSTFKKYVYQNGKQIVISGIDLSQQLSTLSDSSKSLSVGLIVDIRPPTMRPGWQPQK